MVSFSPDVEVWDRSKQSKPRVFLKAQDQCKTVPLKHHTSRDDGEATPSLTNKKGKQLWVRKNLITPNHLSAHDDSCKNARTKGFGASSPLNPRREPSGAQKGAQLRKPLHFCSLQPSKSPRQHPSLAEAFKLHLPRSNQPSPTPALSPPSQAVLRRHGARPTPAMLGILRTRPVHHSLNPPFDVYQGQHPNQQLPPRRVQKLGAQVYRSYRPSPVPPPVPCCNQRILT